MNSSEIVNSLFPFSFNYHVTFCCIATLFLAFMFFKHRKFYQLVMAIAIPISLLLWVSPNRTLFNVVGIIEAILLVTAFIGNIVQKRKNPEPEENKTEQKSSEENPSKP